MKLEKLGVAALAASMLFACGKKKDDDSSDSHKVDGGEDGGGDGVSEKLADPTGVLALVLDSMQSVAQAGFGADANANAGLLLADSENEFTPTDCDEHGSAKARANDNDPNPDDQGRLSIQHPRMPMQDLYCKMQTDSGNPDTFLGALSQSRMILCIMGKDFVFNGEAQEIEVAKADIEACLNLKSEEEKQEVLGGFPATVKATRKASAPSAYGSGWDASIEITFPFGDTTTTEIVLLKDSDDVFGIAYNGAAGRSARVSGYAAVINESTGEIRFESKFQRMRTPDGSSSNGWSRHARVYVKGEMDDNLKFTKVNDVHAAYSDISNNPPGDQPAADSQDDPIQMGSLWTAKGSTSTGMMTHAYVLSCEWNQNEPNVCKDVNLAASWEATAGNGACNGQLDNADNCSGTGIELTTNDQAAFFMHHDHAKFQKTEDWISSLAVPNYTTVDLAQ